ncbi:MAG: 4-hydroxybenzoate octaprenyltransferase [Micavibrio aeruginosavorus]|uniref:4-hydroxybenzoate octaprenyltransferase n=1 Tax=Micavibrio aeruginosavorus TaxID=349221 RepID=A0A2W5FK41_9BACT|nr:MAG: 4-hydroxybenzoate octaprenyltransferase [Micavibrio aeruginosavorus]
MSHTDIQADGWAEKYLPAFCLPYARLARLDRPVGTWLLLLPGLWSITAAGKGFQNFRFHEWYIFFLFVVGAFVMRAAGCVINDLWDRKIDAQVERTKSRPLAAGDVTPAQGIFFLFILLWIGLLILVQLSPAAIFLGVMSIVMVVLYPLAKRVTWYPQFVLGLTFNMGALMGWAAVTGQLGWPALFLYAAGILWTLGYDTIYAHQDKEDDAVIGVKSTALKFGDDSYKWIAGFYGAAAFMILMVGIILNAAWPFFVGWAACGFHLIIQLHCWNIHDPSSSLATFRSNRNFALLVLLALALVFIRI